MAAEALCQRAQGRRQIARDEQVVEGLGEHFELGFAPSLLACIVAHPSGVGCLRLAMELVAQGHEAGIQRGEAGRELVRPCHRRAIPQLRQQQCRLSQQQKIPSVILPGRQRSQHGIRRGDLVLDLEGTAVIARAAQDPAVVLRHQITFQQDGLEFRLPRRGDQRLGVGGGQHVADQETGFPQGAGAFAQPAMLDAAAMGGAGIGFGWQHLAVLAEPENAVERPTRTCLHLRDPAGHFGGAGERGRRGKGRPGEAKHA